MKNIRDGMMDGIPIALGYVSVSFSFGLMAVSAGLKGWQAILISMANLTSAGQVAGLDIIICAGSLIEMALSQLIINVRYSLMSLALSQKIDRKFKIRDRLILGAGITDEIFAVAMSKDKKITRSYMFGLICIPYIGWAVGTGLGALVGGILPIVVRESLGVAIYGMFMAIIIPKAKESKAALFVIVISALLSCAFNYMPILSRVSSGFVIIICAVVASLAGAVLFPRDLEKEE